MENDIGRIETGLFADMLVLGKNPLEDVTVLDTRENILAVVKEGRVVTSVLENLSVDVVNEPW